MNKKEQVVEILKTLLKRKDGKFEFWKDNIEDAIMECRGCDRRTLHNWWNYLWRMGYFIQSRHGIYVLNVEKVVTLECPELSAHQTTLAEHSHSHFSKEG
mgnify:CR=1